MEVSDVSDIYKSDLQRLVGKWLKQKLRASKIHGTITAAQVLWRDFDLITGTDNLLANDPTLGLRLPLRRQLDRTGRKGKDLVFGRTATQSFNSVAAAKRPPAGLAPGSATTASAPSLALQLRIGTRVDVPVIVTR
jgi:hypothetical protein